MVYGEFEKWIDERISLTNVYDEDTLQKEILDLYEKEKAKVGNKANGIKKFAEDKLWEKVPSWDSPIFGPHLLEVTQETVTDYSDEQSTSIENAKSQKEVEFIITDIQTSERPYEAKRELVEKAKQKQSELRSAKEQVYSTIREASNIQELLAIDVPEADDQPTYLKTVLRTKYNELSAKELKE